MYVRCMFANRYWTAHGSFHMLRVQSYMLSQFFLEPATRDKFQLLVAWGGVVVLIGHAVVHGWVKYAINEWYGAFYNLLEEAGAMTYANSTPTEREWVRMQGNVVSELVKFAAIAAVSIVVMPISKYVRSAWALKWRVALMHSYTTAWNANRAPIEGASQRVHEDTYRFSKGVELCLTTMLDSVITLGVFIPVLTHLGSATPCPASVSAFAWLRDGWLVGMAVSSASIGVCVTIILGQKLVQLEVENQVVEARIRKDLVILETYPSSVCVAQEPAGDQEFVDVDTIQSTVLLPPLPHFLPVFGALQTNYNRLFLNFGALNLWLAFFDQFNVILPYLVFGPLLFDPNPHTRILLGTLVQVSNSFDKVFGSMSVVAESWSGGPQRNASPLRARARCHAEGCLDFAPPQSTNLGRCC